MNYLRERILGNTREVYVRGRILAKRTKRRIHQTTSRLFHASRLFRTLSACFGVFFPECPLSSSAFPFSSYPQCVEESHSSLGGALQRPDLRLRIFFLPTQIAHSLRKKKVSAKKGQVRARGIGHRGARACDAEEVWWRRSRLEASSHPHWLARHRERKELASFYLERRWM